jgi:capsular polysaccharide biosynthesis protein
MEPRASNPPNLQITLRDLLAPLFRLWRILLATFLCVFAVTAWLGFLCMYKYASHMTIAFEPASITEEEVQSFAALFQSRDLLEKVALASHLEQNNNLKLGHPDALEQAVRALARDLQVSVPRKSHLIQVGYLSPDPMLTYRVLTSLSTLYLEHNNPARAQQRPGPQIFVAVPPAIPVLPMHSAGSILLLACMLALVATGVAGFFTQYFDPHFHSPADVIDVLGIPVVEAVEKKLA